MPPLDHFASSYTEARAKFHAAAALAGFAVESHPHPLKGPQGEDLALDVVAVCGGVKPATTACEAERVFIVMSGTHGVEAFAGAAAQTAWLAEGHWRGIPSGVAVLLLHAVNPHGFAHLRRVTEGNVDLNRNFWDFSQPAPKRPAYDELRDYICPQAWTADVLKDADTALAAFAAKHGQPALDRAVMGGQFCDAQGVFYGGAKPTWSRERILSILRAHTRKAQHVALMDVHTGLGDFGHGACMVIGAPDSPALMKAKPLWGDDAVLMPTGTARQIHEGYNLSGIARELAPAAFYGVTLEFGTRPLADVLQALRADNWLYLHGDVSSAQGRAIKADIKHALYPEESADWKTRILDRSLEVWRRGLRGIAAL